jgi:hypothetical protein
MSSFNKYGGKSYSVGSTDNTSIFDVANLIENSSTELKYNDNCYFDPTQNFYYGGQYQESGGPSAAAPDQCESHQQDYHSEGEGEAGWEGDDYGYYATGSMCAELDWVGLAERLDALLQRLRPNRSFSAEAVLYALQSHVDPEADAAALETQLATAADSLARTDRRSAEARPPCRHLLQGRCYRRDCAFEHDLAAVTCTYWLASGCASGAACPFAHALDYAAAEAEGATGGAAAAAVYVEEEDAFPSLTVSCSSSSSSAGKPTSKTDYKAACQTSSWGPTGGEAASQPRAVAGDGWGRRGGAEEELLDVGAWVDSGRAVAADYARQRSEAAALASARNSCFHQATQAYLG